MSPAPNAHLRRAYLLVNLATLVWATNFALGRLLRGDIGPFTLTAARFTVAVPVLLLLARRSLRATGVPRRNWPLLAGMALAGVFGFTILLYSGLRLTTATDGTLINGASPLVIGLLAAALLREPFSARGVIGALLSLAGVAFIASGGSLAALAAWRLNPGDLLILAAVVMWGLYSIMSRVATRTQSALTATAVSTALALPLLYPAAALEWRANPPALTAFVVLAVLYIGVVPSVVGYLAWNEGVRLAGPARATAFYNMLPVYGALLGVLFLGESFGWVQLIGGVLIIGGSLFAVSGRR